MDRPPVSKSISGYFRNPITPKNTKNTIDATSRKGKFGWTTIDGVHLPYIIRNEVKYLSVRMVGNTLIRRYIRELSHHVYCYNRIKAFFVTKSEYKLLNEINRKHLKRAHGKKKFSKKSLITQLKDTIKFYNYVKFCYFKVSNVYVSLMSNCGFIKIGSTIVPYINLDEDIFVPTFFFGGDLEISKSKYFVESWNWAYLKFYCYGIGMKHHELPLNVCPVINVIDLRPLLYNTEQYKFVAPFLFEQSCSLVKGKNDVTLPWFIT